MEEVTTIQTPQADAPDDGSVLETAARLAAEPGDGLTMERLAAASGLSRATLYRRFGSRRALVRSSIVEMFGVSSM